MVCCNVLISLNDTLRRSPTAMHFRVRKNSGKQRRTAGALAVISPVGRSKTQDFRRKREAARCKFPARTAKTAESSWDACVSIEARGGGIDAALDRRDYHNLRAKSRC